jgi:hypothetical protein
MKNIHVLPTEKPSRLVIDTIENKLYLQPILHEKTVNVLTQNIYITSDEEIKEGDWIYDASEMSVVKCPQIISKPNYFTQFCKKIILTTDQDLIKDGVQDINDEFLEWFVKNPSYEEVYIIKQYKQVNQDNPLHKGSTALRFSHYEIHLLKATKQMIDEWNLIYCKLNSRQIPIKEEQTKCYCGHTNYCDCGPEEPKQETLEEFAEIWVQNRFTKQIKDEDIYASKSSIIESHILFTKWQQEKSYSEEEVIKFGQWLSEFNNLDNESEYVIKELLEQFKNK